MLHERLRLDLFKNIIIVGSQLYLNSMRFKI